MRFLQPLKRREFLKQTLAATAGLGAFGVRSPLSPMAQAQSTPERPDRYYIFCYFEGAWDILVGLDPRDPRVFTNGNIGTTRIQPGYELLRTGYDDIVDLGEGRVQE